jgi:hypothetical protein
VDPQHDASGDAEQSQWEVIPPAKGRPASRPARGWWLAGILLVAFSATGLWLALGGTWRGWRAVATVDGVRITRADLDRHLEWLLTQERVRPEAVADPRRKAEVERSALEDLINRQVMGVEARRLGITVAPGEEDMAFGKAHAARWGEAKLVESAKRTGEDVARLREEVRRQLLTTRLAEKVTSDVAVGDDDVERYYHANRQAFFIPGAAQLRLLIVDSREEAERLRRQAVAGEDFPALVRAHSTGGAKERGGDLGWVEPRMLPAPLAAAVEAIPRTGITPVVEAGKRYYLVRVEGRREPRQLTLRETQDQIRQLVTAQRKQARFAEWLEERRRSARIEIFL